MLKLNVLLIVLLSVERHHCITLRIVLYLRLRHILGLGRLLELLHQILLLLELARFWVLKVSDWDEDKLLVAVFISSQLLVALDNLIVLIDDLTEVSGKLEAFRLHKGLLFLLLALLLLVLHYHGRNYHWAVNHFVQI